MQKVYTSFEGHKPRLSSRFSWPIGVEALSNCLSDVPQFDELEVHFDDHPVPRQWTITMNKIADQKAPYQVITVRYSVIGREPRWYLLVYPVESQLRKRVKELLEIEGIQRIREFLRKEHTETQLRTNLQFRCVFNPIEMSLAYEYEEG